MNETLLSGEGGPEGESRANPSRGNRNGYTPVQMPAEDSRGDRDSEGVNMNSRRFSRVGSTGVCIDGLDTARQNNKVKTRKVVGTSLLILPSIKSLKKAGWLQKRGHMVRNWKKRFIVLIDGEILYYDKANKAETNGAGKPKGKLHLLGAICEFKQNDSVKLPTIEIIGRQGEKDLLLQYATMTEAYEWFDTINWTIFRWNLNSIESGDGPEETNRWYHQQLKKFDTDFEDLEKGYTFRKHGFDSITGDLQATNCIVLGFRDDLCLKWSNIIEEDGKKKKSQAFTIYISDIVDLIVGHYENDGDDVRMMSIVTSTHTLDLEIIDQAASDVLTQALSKCLLFMSIPVPQGMTGAETKEQAESATATSSLLKANKKAGAAHKHGGKL